MDSDGLSGGLGLFWNDQLHVEIKDANERYIDAYVRLSDNAPLWRLTCVYGEPRSENRHHMWSLMQKLKTQSELPWCVLGDFNEALWSFEHFSASQRSESQMLAFRDTLELCELIDLGFSGLPFTCDNKRRGRRDVKVRLDRAAADNKWRDIFSESRVVHQVSPCSDHSPIVLHCEAEVVQQRKKSQRRY